MEKLDPKKDGSSPDVISENIEKLRELFPEAFTEGSDEDGPRWKVDFDTLKEIIGEYGEKEAERYSFTWHGKSRARLIAQTPSTGTLRPCPEESVNWDTTKNLFIEGDNLEVLKLLQKSYHKKVKMIYIDPPYNTGNDFIYPDKFADNLDTYLRYTGQIDDEGFKVSTNSDGSGRYHTNWLNMMYPRLKLARNLLTDDGILLSSIDEHEMHHLRKLCDEVFGEENYAGEIVWKNSSKNDQDYISMQHEYFLVYVKDRNANKGAWTERKEGLEDIYKAFDSFREKHGNDWDAIHEEALDWYKSFNEANPIRGSKHYNWMDEKGVYFAADISGPNHGQYLYDIEHPETHKPCKRPASGWRYPKETMLKRISEGLVHFGKDHTTVPNNKIYLRDAEYQSVSSVRYKDGRVASKKLAALFGGAVFTNPKDSDLLSSLFESFEVTDGDIAMDFFAGSGTTAESIMRLNATTGSSCRFIMVQLPENLYVTLANATGGAKATTKRAIDYLEKRGKDPNLSEIAKERIRLVARNIREEAPHGSIDLGFRVFQLSSSNIKPWEADFDNVEQALLNSVDNIKSDRSEEDVLYELLLKYGLDLAIPIETRSVLDKKVYVIGGGALIVSLADGIDAKLAEGIVSIRDEIRPEVIRVVFKDSGFKDDVAKTNVMQVLKQAGIEDVKSL